MELTNNLIEMLKKRKEQKKPNTRNTKSIKPESKLHKQQEYVPKILNFSRGKTNFLKMPSFRNLDDKSFCEEREIYKMTKSSSKNDFYKEFSNSDDILTAEQRIVDFIPGFDNIKECIKQIRHSMISKPKHLKQFKSKKGLITPREKQPIKNETKTILDLNNERGYSTSYCLSTLVRSTRLDQFVQKCLGEEQMGIKEIDEIISKLKSSIWGLPIKEETSPKIKQIKSKQIAKRNNFAEDKIKNESFPNLKKEFHPSLIPRSVPILQKAVKSKNLTKGVNHRNLQETISHQSGDIRKQIKNDWCRAVFPKSSSTLQKTVTIKEFAPKRLGRNSSQEELVGNGEKNRTYRDIGFQNKIDTSQLLTSTLSLQKSNKSTKSTMNYMIDYAGRYENVDIDTYLKRNATKYNSKKVLPKRQPKQTKMLQRISKNNIIPKCNVSKSLSNCAVNSNHEKQTLPKKILKKEDLRHGMTKKHVTFQLPEDRHSRKGTDLNQNDRLIIQEEKYSLIFKAFETFLSCLVFPKTIMEFLFFVLDFSRPNGKK